MKATLAASEIERKSARQRAAYAQQRAMGIPPKGPRAFGFKEDRRTPLEAEAKYIREAYRILLSDAEGEGTVYAVRRYFAEQGIKTMTGRDWSQATVRQLITRPSNAGLMRANDGGLQVGKIKPIVSRETWDAAQAVLSAPGRTVPAGRKPVKFWLAGVARCGGCGGPMKAAGAKGHDYYRCKVATEPRVDKTIKHVAMRAADLEAIVMARIFEEVQAGRFDGEEGSAARVDEVNAEISSLRERMAAAQAAMLDGLGDAAQWRAGLAKLSQRAEALEGERDRLLARGGAVAPIAEKWRRLASGLDDQGKGWAVLKGWPVMYQEITPEERRALARGLGKISVERGRAKPMERVKFSTGL
ncbi:recombinase family protein [Agrococcus sediminis]|uniref:recombinase family protein n=1 Tax=Agrococcus sediminis TaxID=2599924 RepID=UPI00341D47C3